MDAQDRHDSGSGQPEPANAAGSPATPEDAGTAPANGSPPPARTPWWRRSLRLLQATGILDPEEWPVKRLLVTAFLLAITVTVVAVLRHGVAHIRGEQVGVMVSNWSGAFHLKERVGYHVFIPYHSSLYVLDKTIQRMDLTWAGSGAGAGREVAIKTADGSHVSLDVTVTYKLDPQKAVTVLRRSGQDMRFGQIWVEPFTRHACFAAFGQLSTEEMYDSVKRSQKVDEAHAWLNTALDDQGIEIIALILGEFRFYQEYEQVIQEKKLADQQVQEQQAQARMLLKDQERQIIEARKRSENRIAAFQGETTNMIIQAQAEADRTRRQADGYYHGTLMAADAALYSASSAATGRRATLYAEAEGLEALQEALAGDGGIGMVALEYAKRLDSVRFSGTPITREPSVRQFAIQPDEAAAMRRGN